MRAPSSPDTVHKHTTNCCTYTTVHSYTISTLTSVKDTGFRGEGPGTSVGGVIPYDNRVLGGVPGVLVLGSAYDILNTCKVVCIHHK